MKNKDELRLRHMLDAAREAVAFAVGRTRQELDTNRMLVLALIKEIEIIGEAANGVSSETRDRIPDIPWQDVIAMRHRLIHGYFDVDLEVVWQTVKQDLPLLESALDQVLTKGG